MEVFIAITDGHLQRYTITAYIIDIFVPGSKFVNVAICCFSNEMIVMPTPTEYSLLSMQLSFTGGHLQSIAPSLCLINISLTLHEACDAHTYRTFIVIQFLSLVDTCRGNIPPCSITVYS